MKKLLLGSMLVLGATSFGAVSSQLTGSTTTDGAGDVRLPIVVKGNVVNTTKTTLIVQAIKNAGVSGDVMEFDFGSLAVGTRQTLDGLFETKLIKNGKEIDFTKAPSFALEGGTVNGNGDSTVVDEADSKAKLEYSLGKPTKKEKTYNGTLSISAEGKKVGTFIDRSVNVKVTVAGQDMTK